MRDLVESETVDREGAISVKDCLVGLPVGRTGRRLTGEACGSVIRWSFWFWAWFSSLALR